MTTTRVDAHRPSAVDFDPEAYELQDVVDLFPNSQWDPALAAAEAVSAAALTGCTISVPPSSSAPAPATTSAAALPAGVDARELAAYKLAWADQSADAKESICQLFNTDPSTAYLAFTDYGSRQADRETFTYFFEGVC